MQKIRDKALELHQYRNQQMEQKQWGITKLYNAYFDEPASQLYKLHKQLDALVLQAYNFSPDDDLLEKLLTLNLALAAQEQNGQPVIGPWDPTTPHPPSQGGPGGIHPSPQWRSPQIPLKKGDFESSSPLHKGD